MFKKFFKKIGKGIKKVSKSIGKGLRKLFKSKVGKIIGTVALMFIAPYLLSSAGSFFTGSLGTAVVPGGVGAGVGGVGAGAGAGGTAAAGSAKALTVGQKMVNAFKAVGSKIKTAYNTVTEGITNFFTGGTGGVSSGTEKLVGNAVKPIKGVELGKLPTVKTDLIQQQPFDTSTIKEVIDPITGKVDTKVVSVKAAPSDILLSETGAGPSTTSSLLEKDLQFVDPSGGVKPDLLSGKTDLEVTRGARVTSTGDVAQIIDEPRFPKLAKAWKEMDFSELREKTIGYKPLESFEKLPAIVRKGTIGEAKLLYDVTRPAPDFYQQPSVDVSQAVASLEEVDITGSGATQLPSSMPMDVSMATKPMNAATWMDMINRHGYLYSASKIGLA